LLSVGASNDSPKVDGAGKEAPMFDFFLLMFGLEFIRRRRPHSKATCEPD